MTHRIRIGTAPDSWGVWFADDDAQVAADVFLSEARSAGYDAIELGPYGYLPSDPALLQDKLDEHGFDVLAGTVFSALHREDSWDDVWSQVTDVAALTRAVGGRHIVVIPDLFRDHKTGEAIEARHLDEGGWQRITEGHDELGRRILDEYGLHVQFHSHADSHVGHQADIERFVENTDPAYVNLCLDTGHVAYYGGDAVDLVRRYPDRIGYLHLKQVDPAVIEKVHAEDIPFPAAVAMGAMTEPPNGVPDLGEVLREVDALGRDILGIIEHDLYPCAPDVPLPIARRTRTFLGGCGVGAVDLGTPAGGAA